jgi:predicted nicotinamide N-methyase
VNLSPEDFIRQRFALSPLPFRPDIALYRPQPQSGLTAWLAAEDRADAPPYWAYAWAGGAALALYLQEHPEAVAGRTVLDFGSGSGLVAIAAARAGATVAAYDPAPLGRIATALNAEANGIRLTICEDPRGADIVLAGDVFYSAEVAASALPTLVAMARNGASVLVGDPFRRDLPTDRLTLTAQYQVPDMGGLELVPGGVFTLHP